VSQKQVLIVGGGFGGIKAALDLEKHSDKFKVTLVSSRPEFRYYPMLYHTATGGSRVVSSIPLGEIFGGKKVSVIIDNASKLDRQNKTLRTEGNRELKYDILILALGVVTNYFGIKGLEEYSYGIKSLEEAEELKAHLQAQLIDEHRPDLNYVIVGGGPSGIELAGELPHYLHQLMKKHGVTDRKIHVDLIESAPRLMPRMPESVSHAIYRHLTKVGVKVITGQPVQAETADNLLVGGKPIRSHTVIWTAGVTNHPFFKANNFAITDKGKVHVDRLLQAWPGIFVIGDNADTPYAGMAQTALHDGKTVAENLIRHANSERPYAYKPKKPIYVTPAGPHWAAVVWGPLHIYGWLGWAVRRAADWIGYHDMEPWWKASARFLADSVRED
jgi:NADH dehydrogenase